MGKGINVGVGLSMGMDIDDGVVMTGQLTSAK